MQRRDFDAAGRSHRPDLVLDPSAAHRKVVSMSFRPRRLNTPKTVTGRVVTILGVFSAGHAELGLMEISRLAGLPSATTSRLVSELSEWGALERGADLRYRIGPRLRQLTLAGTRVNPAEERICTTPSWQAAVPSDDRRTD
jgi:hypothetical protein